jgi:hypothetical protein
MNSKTKGSEQRVGNNKVSKQKDDAEHNRMRCQIDHRQTRRFINTQLSIGNYECLDEVF